MINTLMCPTRNLKEWTHRAQHASPLLVSPTAFVEKDYYYSNGPHKNLKEWTHRAQHAAALLVSPAAAEEGDDDGWYRDHEEENHSTSISRDGDICLMQKSAKFIAFLNKHIKWIIDEVYSRVQWFVQLNFSVN